MYHKFDYKLQK